MIAVVISIYPLGCQAISEQRATQIVPYKEPQVPRKYKSRILFAEPREINTTTAKS